MLHIVITFLILSLPWMVEVFALEKKGDKHNGPGHLIIRFLIAAVACVVDVMIMKEKMNIRIGMDNFANSAVYCVTIFMFCFPQAVNWWHHKNGVTENKDWYNNMNQKVWPDSMK